jgi:hypothetical protein
VRQKIVNRHLGAERQPEVVASSPLGEVLVERELRRLDSVAKRLKQPVQYFIQYRGMRSVPGSRIN